MMRWSDLGAGLLAAPRVLLRADLWLEVLRRALFSRVFAGYALLALLAFMAGRALYTGYAREIGGIVTVVFAIAAGPLLLLLAGVLLLPYVYWVFNPPAARMLQRYLDLPPPLEAEPAFSRHLAWTLPTLGAVLLALGQDLLPVGNRWLDLALFLAASAVVLLAVMKLFARSALAAFYDRADTERFLAATRRQRLLVWLPVVLLVAVLLQFVAGALQMPVLAWSRGASDGGKALLFLLALAVQALVYAFATIAFAGALLLACGRTPASGIGAPRTQGLHSVTVPYTPPRRPSQAAPAGSLRTGPSRARFDVRWLRIPTLLATLLAAVAGGLYLAREPLADWHFSADAEYRDAPAGILVADRAAARGKPLFDATLRPERLRAGYISYGCSGRLDRARWIHALGITTAADDGRMLACAACSGQRATVEWLLRSQAAVPLASPVQARPGHPRTALQCAARDGNVALVRELVERGAAKVDPDGPSRPLEIAAGRHQWEVVRLLRVPAQAQGSATVAALASAYAQGRDKPLEVLPRLLDAGLRLEGVDEQGRNAFHWAAMHHDLALARAMMDADRALPRPPSDPYHGPAGPHLYDHQGQAPWTYVLRKAELDAQPLSAEALELLRLLIPPEQTYLMQMPHFVRKRLAPGQGFPIGWSPAQVLVNEPEARAIFGPKVEFGRLPDDPALWWKFRGRAEAEAFVRDLSLDQLFNAENPYPTPNGSQPKRVSEALAERGWTDLAEAVRAALRDVKSRAAAMAAGASPAGALPAAAAR